jgi:hypothetical protein
VGSEIGFGVGQLKFAGPVVDQPNRPGRLTVSAARTNVALFIHRAVRPRTPPGVGTPLRADGLVDATRVVELSNPKEWE